jgi:hypothetical protein
LGLREDDQITVDPMNQIDVVHAQPEMIGNLHISVLTIGLFAELLGETNRFLRPDFLRLPPHVPEFTGT